MYGSRIGVESALHGIEVEEEGLERLRKAAKKAPRRSDPPESCDYLVISYVFYNRGLIPPHIAAGINLSFFPLGYIFRRCGAFFIRRTFKDNPVYGMTFRHYLKNSQGRPLGRVLPGRGRSRTGKVLPPKLGMLRNCSVPSLMVFGKMCISVRSVFLTRRSSRKTRIEKN